MDSRTGDLYYTFDEAKEAGVPIENIVELLGTEESIMSVSKAIKAQRRKKNKAARKSRKKNR